MRQVSPRSRSNDRAPAEARSAHFGRPAVAEAEEGDTLLPASDEAEDIAHRLEVVKLRTLGRRRCPLT